MLLIQNIEAKYYKSPNRLSKYESAYVIEKPECTFAYALHNRFISTNEIFMRFYNLNNIKINWEISSLKYHQIMINRNNSLFKQINQKRLREILNKTLNK